MSAGLDSCIDSLLIENIIQLWVGNKGVIKGTVSDKKNLQITLEMKKRTFQSQHVSFFLKKSHNFGRKTTFYRISFHGHWTLFLSTGKISLNLEIKFFVYLSIKAIKTYKPLEYQCNCLK